jgi:hypothetical protein
LLSAGKSLCTSAWWLPEHRANFVRDLTLLLNWLFLLVLFLTQKLSRAGGGWNVGVCKDLPRIY